MIDWHKVNELREEIGEEDFAEVVDLFLEEVEGAIQELRNGVEESQLECNLHFLKGSALNLGFRDFSTLCADGEVAAAAKEYDRIDLSQVIQIYDQSKNVFLTKLQAQQVA